MKTAFQLRFAPVVHAASLRSARGVFPLALVMPLMLAAPWLSACLAPAAEPDEAAKTKAKYTVKQGSTIELFDGKSLAGWNKTKFGGEGEVAVKDGKLTLDFGASMTGITYAGKAKLPTTNYEVTLDAMRVEGNDFFCGLTFPVGKSHCSFVCGGWGGGTVGLSSIDHYDASENSTSSYREFKSKTWYRIRVRVTDEAIECWIDNEQLVDQERAGHEIGTRIEMDLSKPLGVATWETSAALKNLKLQLLEKAR